MDNLSFLLREAAFLIVSPEKKMSNRDTIKNDRDTISNDRDTIRNVRDTIRNDRGTIRNDRDTLRNERDTAIRNFKNRFLLSMDEF